MSEERRVAPGPSAVDAASTAQSMSSKADGTPSSPPVDGSAARTRLRDASTAARKRNRTLRIPDDEITRPQTLPSREAARPPSSPAESTPPSEPPEGHGPPTWPDDVVLKPLPIISIDAGPAPAALEPQPEAMAPDAPGEPDGVEVRFDDDAPTPALPPVRAELVTPTDPDRPALPFEPHEPPTPQAAVSEPASPAARAASPEPAARGPVPEPPAPRASPEPPPARALSPERRPAASEPPPSEPGDGELSADDLVPLDATPAPPKPASNLPPVRARLPSHPPLPPPASKRAAPARPARAPLVIVPPHMGNVAPQATEGSGLRRKGRFWWEDLFNDDYLRATERLTEAQLAAEVDFIEDSLGIERGGAVLDLACGTGRHAVELARRGYEVVGFDLSLTMLARASEEAQEHDAKLNFLQGDMREMTFAEQFDGVYCWNTSFGYFEEEKNAQVINRIHGALKAGGLLLLDVVNRDFVVRQSPSLAWFEGDGCVCMDEMTVDFITSRLRVKRTMMLDDGRSREIEYSMRVYSLHELGKLLHDHGFKVCEVSGGTATPGAFLGHDSPRTIILAEKR